MRSDVWQAWKENHWRQILAQQTQIDAARHLVRNPFLIQALPAQRPPDEPGWRTWLFLGGRGAGKTRAGAEWLRYALLYGGYKRAALIGPTLGDVREVMIEGPSGLKAITPPYEAAPIYEVSRRRLVWPNGAKAYAFSAEDPDSLRGPQFDVAWCDELAAWAKGNTVWDMLQMGLRLGDAPCAMVTTTPRPIALLKTLLAAPSTTITRASTADNAANLAPDFLTAMQEAYGETRLARQELYGELIEDHAGALWSRSQIEAVTVNTAPHMDNIVVAIDPPISKTHRSDACGIVAVGIPPLGPDDPPGRRRAYVLADASEQGLSPLDWAGRATALATRLGAGYILAEANQGGEMVRHALQTAGCTLPIRLVHAKAGKTARALPVAALYEAGRVSHVGAFPALEDEMCSFGADGFRGSPDRVDALVWAIWTLLLDQKDPPRVRRMNANLSSNAPRFRLNREGDSA